MEIRKSDVNHPDAGYGVHLKGVAMPGTVIAFYPGVVYFVDDIPVEVVKDNDYMFSRYDSVIVDGRQWDRMNEKAKLKQKNFAYAAGTLPAVATSNSPIPTNIFNFNIV